MTHTKNVAVVVPIYNSARWVRYCVRYLLKNTGKEVDIFLRNDHSADISVECVLEEFMQNNRVFISRNSRNLGFLGTCNLAFNSLRDKYKYVFLCNSDVLITPGAIEKGVALFGGQDDLGLVSYLATYGANLTVMLPMGLDHLELDAYLDKNPLRSDACAVTCVGHLLGIRTSAVKGNLLFDPLFGRGYGEESDLHYRLRRDGFRSGVCPNSFVYHRGEASFGSGYQKENISLFWARWGDDFKSETKSEKADYSLKPLRTPKNWLLNRKITRSILRARKNNKHKVKLLIVDLFDVEYFDDLCYWILESAGSTGEVIVFCNVSLYSGRNLPCKVFDHKNKSALLSYVANYSESLEVDFSKPSLKQELSGLLDKIQHVSNFAISRDNGMNHLFRHPEYIEAFRQFHNLITSQQQ